MEWETAPFLTNCLKRCILQTKNKKQINYLKTWVWSTLENNTCCYNDYKRN